MKKTLSLIAVACCVVQSASLPVLADSKPEAKNGQSLREVAAVKSAPGQRRVVYYITTETHTGSLIPMVYRGYNGHIDSASNPAVYGSNAIRATGSLNVSNALIMLDPSISTSYHR